jgi:hypothetical protein
MYSSAGLQDWELLTVSFCCAATMLVAGSTIGAFVAWFFTREPHVVTAAAPATARPTLVREGAVEEKKPRLVMG